jgi:hypothetical protein
VAVSREKHAKTAGIEVESIDDGLTCEGMPGDDNLKRETLELVCGLDSDRRQPYLVQEEPDEVLLVIV